jgi:predicted DCC family thiol-disulfide oxidoreductase YuxK
MGTPDALSNAKEIILFDGVCNLCNSAVQFILKRDPHQHFVFASLQSDIAKEKLQEAGATHSLTTMILLTEGKYYDRSNAALEIAKRLKGLWPLLYVFKIIPRFIRDAIYTWLANNRYRLFGKRDACMIPSPEWKDRFLE